MEPTYPRNPDKPIAPQPPTSSQWPIQPLVKGGQRQGIGRILSISVPTLRQLFATLRSPSYTGPRLLYDCISSFDTSWPKVWNCSPAK